MTLKEALKELKALGDEKVRVQNAKGGAGDDQFGVSLGDIRVLAKKIRTDHALALSLWDSGNVDAQFLAALLIQPQMLGIYRDYPVSKGCTSPFAPIWIDYMVKKKG